MGVDKTDATVPVVVDFVVSDGILMVRECRMHPKSLSPNGKPKGKCGAVTMRPATVEEVAEYKKAKRAKNADQKRDR